MTSDPRKEDPPKKRGITTLLQALPSRQDELYSLVYNHLKAIAHNRVSAEGKAGALEATALVSEAYFKLAGQHGEWRDRRHFYGVAARPCGGS